MPVGRREVLADRNFRMNFGPGPWHVAWTEDQNAGSILIISSEVLDNLF